jgi:hypothetical protein
MAADDHLCRMENKKATTPATSSGRVKRLIQNQ